mmetsp:Transcript_104183/g.324921  ORF Transcript_104183/g.324921 Transcript_104183/m.324921 type:complete len:252 (-) Transcript_104183:110-865(-)
MSPELVVELPERMASTERDSVRHAAGVLLQRVVLEPLQVDLNATGAAGGIVEAGLPSPGASLHAGLLSAYDCCPDVLLRRGVDKSEWERREIRPPVHQLRVVVKAGIPREPRRGVDSRKTVLAEQAGSQSVDASGWQLGRARRRIGVAARAHKVGGVVVQGLQAASRASAQMGRAAPVARGRLRAAERLPPADLHVRDTVVSGGVRRALCAGTSACGAWLLRGGGHRDPACNARQEARADPGHGLRVSPAR